jgi:hypothetical protein
MSGNVGAGKRTGKQGEGTAPCSGPGTGTHHCRSVPVAVGKKLTEIIVIAMAEFLRP